MGSILFITYGLLCFGMGYWCARNAHKPRGIEVYADKETRGKVISALRASGLDASQTFMALTYMRSRGILFREPKKPDDIVNRNVGSVG
jgi:hypothetical protein